MYVPSQLTVISYFKGTLPWTFQKLNVIVHGFKWLVNGLPFEDMLPYRIYKTVDRVYPTYLHFDT